MNAPNEPNLDPPTDPAFAHLVSKATKGSHLRISTCVCLDTESQVALACKPLQSCEAFSSEAA